MIEIKLQGDETVRATFAKLEAGLKDKVLARTAVDAQRLIEVAADKHTKTGALFQSVDSRKIPGGYEVFHDLQRAPHAIFVHWGTKPHRIEPKNRKRLRWVSGGQFVFSKGVNHPGYAGDPYFQRTADEVPRIFAQHVDAIIKGL